MGRAGTKVSRPWASKNDRRGSERGNENNEGEEDERDKTKKRQLEKKEACSIPKLGVTLRRSAPKAARVKLVWIVFVAAHRSKIRQ
jgi:hypothetical protein